MTVPVNAVLRVIPTFDMRGVSKMQNRFHLYHLTSSEQPDEDVVEACGEWIVRFYADIKAAWHEDITLEKVEVYIRESGEWNPLGIDNPTVEGDSATDPCPSGVCMLLKAYKSRSGHSDKKYIGGFVDANVTGDTFVAGVITLGEDTLDNWIDQFTATNSVVLIGIHYNEAVEGAATYVTGEVSSLVSYQRRRRPGVGLS